MGRLKDFRALETTGLNCRVAMLLAACVLGVVPAGAQAPHGAASAAAAPVATAPVTAVQAAPAAAPAPLPNWPANAAAAPAVVQWDSHGLHISAANSSLRQILTEVSTLTGAKLEGMGSDERVFGEYGPGQAREVLAQLLHGSAYNIMLIGDQGQGTPREIVLSPRSAGMDAHPARPVQQQQEADDEAEEPPQQPEEQPQQPQQTPPQQPQAVPERQPGQPGTPGQPPNHQ